jgi:hypothetical protein
MSHSDRNLLKFELGISNDLASLLVSGDKNFICRSSAEIITLQPLVSSLDAMTMQ